MMDPTSLMTVDQDALHRLKLFEKTVMVSDFGTDISVKFVFDRYNFKFKAYWNTGHLFMFEICLSYYDNGLESINVNILSDKIPGYDQLKSAIYRASVVSGLDSIRKAVIIFDIQRK